MRTSDYPRSLIASLSSLKPLWRPLLSLTLIPAAILAGMIILAGR
jgi:hypothetical protein